jgi:hypothetical protein
MAASRAHQQTAAKWHVDEGVGAVVALAEAAPSRVDASVTEISDEEGIGFPTIRPTDRAGGATLFVVRS